ncbi:hypothetical protein Aglo01_04830 [Actinokineospora globicatena]|nr:hypothetical protein Aglo01_04830 [Actinokineospora globicatena]
MRHQGALREIRGLSTTKIHWPDPANRFARCGPPVDRRWSPEGKHVVQSAPYRLDWAGAHS